MPHPTKNNGPSGTLRAGDRVRTLPGSGDNLIGKCNAVFHAPDGRRYYRVQFPFTSPYFTSGTGVIYREGEVERFTAAPATSGDTVTLPQRPKPTRTQ